MIRRVTDKSLVLATRFASQGTRILATMVLARLVAKGDFGRYAMILAVPALLSAAGDFGITRSITTNPDLPDEEIRDTALVLMVAMALILGTLAVAAGWYFDVRLNDPRLRWVGLLVAAYYVIQNIQAVQLALLARELRFVRWAGVEALTTLATVVTGVGVAVAGGGIFALPVQQLIAAVIGLAITLRSKPLARPRHFRRSALGRFYSFGWRMTLFQYANNVQAGVSTLAIGKIGGDVAVGVFGRATQVRDLLGHNLVTTFDLILMPLMARAKNDLTRLRELFIRGSVGVTAFTAFGAAWLAATAPDLIRVVLGGQWDAVPPLLVALTPALAITGFAYPSLVLALALGDPLVNLAYSLISFAGLAIAAAVYFATDLRGFALAQSLFMILPTLFIARWGLRSVRLRPRDLIRRLAPIVALAALTAGLMALVRQGLMPGATGLAASAARLMATSAVGVLAGTALLAVLDRATFRELSDLLFRRGPARTLSPPLGTP